MKPVTVLLTAVFLTSLLITGCRSRGSGSTMPTSATTAPTTPATTAATTPETTETTAPNPTIPSGNGPIDETPAPETTNAAPETTESGSTRRR